MLVRPNRGAKGLAWTVALWFSFEVDAALTMTDALGRVNGRDRDERLPDTVREHVP